MGSRKLHKISALAKLLRKIQMLMVRLQTTALKASKMNAYPPVQLVSLV